MTLSAIAIYLFQTTLAVSILIGLVLLVRRPFAKAFGAKAAYALWTIPFLRLILPPMPANWTLFGWFTGSEAPSTETVTLISEPLVWQPVLLSSTNTNTDLNLSNTLPGFTETSSNQFSVSVLLETALLALPGLWVIGMAVSLVLVLLRQRSSASLINAESHDVSSSLNAMAKETMMRLGLTRRDIAIKTSLLSSGPLVTGLRHPTVLLPEWFEADYTSTEQRFALTHEIMHIKRGDLFALYIASIALALQWFNPLAWLALKAFRSDQEAACDADVLALNTTSPHDYGATLVKAARMSQPVAQPVHAASLPLNHALKERLATMKNPLPSARRRLTGSLLTASVGAAALIASACAASTAQTAELAGGDETETVVSKTQVQSIFISDEDGEKRDIKVYKDGELVDIDELDIEGIEGLAVLKNLEGLEGLEGLEALKSLEGLERNGSIQIIKRLDGTSPGLTTGNAFFFSKDDTLSPPDSAAFAAEMQRLAEDPVANAEEIKSLAAEFEAEMEAWEQEHEARVERSIIALHGGHTFQWSGDFAETECEDGNEVRTVFIQKDEETGATEEHVEVACGLAKINTEEIMSQLRENGTLTEERLAEVQKRLEEATEKLAESEGRLGKIRFKLETETSEEE